MNYYNEFDPFAAKWLVELIKAGLIPNGEVDTRSIVDVRPADLRGFTQCHFFTGIGGWSHALRLAQWPDDKPIWTGSCPCQPFSVAGKKKGKDDDRHLWPVFFQLISECRPPIVMGEQVAGAAGYGWLDGVASDLEGEGYACRAVDIPACAVNAPHIRQRLYWISTNMGDADDTRFSGHGGFVNEHDSEKRHDQERCSAETSILSGEWDQSGDVGNANRPKRQTCDVFGSRAETRSECAAQPSLCGDMANADSRGLMGRETGRLRLQGTPKLCAPKPSTPEIDVVNAESVGRREGRPEYELRGGRTATTCAGGSHWSDAEWRYGADGKARRVKPGVRLLADGVLNRVGKLRGYGNAIVPPLAAEVIKAFMETEIG